MTDTEARVAILVEQLRRADGNLEAFRRNRAVVAGDLAEIICPYRVGDLVEIRGHSYRGKTGIVKDVRIVPYLFRYQWEVEVVVLKDNGEESANRTQFREHDQALPSASEIARNVLG